MIVRIEHPSSGKGLFRAKNEEDKLLLEENTILDTELAIKHSYFPNPFTDSALGWIDEEEFCAFKSLEQLHEWFTMSQLKDITALGFKIYAIEVSKCRTGTHQTLFKRQHITSKSDITDLFL